LGTSGGRCYVLAVLVAAKALHLAPGRRRGRLSEQAVLMGDVYPTELRAAPRRVVALLRLESLHEPLAAQLTAHHGFHVLSIADVDAERKFLPEVPERKPQNHYETYVANGILKKAWVEKHTQLVPAVVVVLFEWEEKPTWKAVEAEVGNRIDRIRHDSRHRPVQILCVRVVHTQQTLDEREEAARQASFRKRADLEPSCILSANCETPVTAARRLAPTLRELADVGYKMEARRLKQVKACVKTTQAALYVRLQVRSSD
jgi:trafficking protein particle complex subunit 11